MYKPFFQYSVYDTIENIYPVIDGSNADVENAIGLRREKLSTYVQSQQLYKGRYRITATEITGRNKKASEMEIVENKELTQADLEVMRRFNKAMRYISSTYSPEFLRKIIVVKKDGRQAAV